MSLLVSIFGGMLLTTLLYAGGRMARLSNYWAAVVSAAIPSFAYLVYGLAQSASLDTITLHVIAYPTVSVLLAMLYGAKARRNPQANWIPRLLIGFFLVMLTLMAGFVYIAGQGLPPALAQVLLPNAEGKNIHTGFAGVVAHQQDAAKGIGQHLGMEHRLVELGWQVEVSGLTNLPAGRAARVTVHIRDAQGQPIPALDVRLGLTRPGQPVDHSLIRATLDKGYQVELPAMEAGTWVAHLRIARSDDVVTLEHGVEVR